MDMKGVRKSYCVKEGPLEDTTNKKVRKQAKQAARRLRPKK